MNLVYELKLTNFSGAEMRLDSLDVLNGDATIQHLEGYDLSAVLQRGGLPVGEDYRVMPASAYAMAFLWVTLDPAAPVPSSLRHRITVGNVSVVAGA